MQTESGITRLKYLNRYQPGLPSLQLQVTFVAHSVVGTCSSIWNSRDSTSHLDNHGSVSVECKSVHCICTSVRGIFGHILLLLWKKSHQNDQRAAISRGNIDTIRQEGKFSSAGTIT